ncbi:Crp/Fnr family transcriptional regulator [Cellulosilyticum sp. I15G10I2]|uniref:Crp/Fnr family transcriptional regulator n=1 Tax=Cellulosilyticum sp. I15G10I2 TaxID=1892843 RepID=UPI00085C8A41|nr:Crp/Fnr family transcriptional regulator [Cellulosilyticum sp. I15G10I2]
MDNIKSILLSTKLFRDLTPDELDQLLATQNITVTTYKKNNFIVYAGEKITSIGLVISGHVLVTKENVLGERIIMSALGKGSLFGEIGAFSDKEVWPATVIAQDEVCVCFINKAIFFVGCVKNCQSHRKIIFNMLNIISNKAMFLNRKVEYLSFKSVRSKIAAFLLDEYKKTKSLTLSLTINRNELADFLNITRPSLSRELANMKMDGLIDYHKYTIKILDLETLSIL